MRRVESIFDATTGSTAEGGNDSRRIKRISQPKVTGQNCHSKQSKLKSGQPIDHSMYRITFVNTDYIFTSQKKYFLHLIFDPLIISTKKLTAFAKKRSIF